MSWSSNGFAKKPSAPAAKHLLRTSDVLFELMIKTLEFDK
jgi:hypothetical protein